MSRTLTAAIAVTLALACGCGRDSRDERTVLRARLTPAVGAAQTWSFTAKESGPHDITLEFPAPMKDQYASALVERGVASVADKTKLPPEFQFTWQILEGPKEVAAGAGQNGVRGSLNQHALVFGAFPAQSGTTYRLRVVLSSQFMTLLRAEPAMVIEAAPTSP